MSRSRSDDLTEDLTDPMRPADHADREAPAGGRNDRSDAQQPALGLIGWLRWSWRQLTSMRTALVLLLLLAVAAIPGSLVPQRTADPNGVTQFYRDNPDTAPFLDWLRMFDVYSSPWFSAIYLLLFVSLIGCVLPRTKHHLKALRSRPPRTPARLSRLADYETHEIPAGRLHGDAGEAAEGAAASAEGAVAVAAQQLRRAGFRVQRYDSRGSWSVSAERGYLRETGNLIFHASLVGVLVAIGFGGGFAYTGQRVVVEGTTFVNTLGDYSSFNPGRFVDGTGLAPYAMTLDEFQVTYEAPGTAAAGQAGDFAAIVTTREPGVEDRTEEVRVNYPLSLAGDQIYLLGNGYAPTITIRDADGEVIYHESQPFLPQDSNMTSLGVVKVPDGLPEQLGMVGFFYPTQGTLHSGAFTSVFPDLINPVLTLNVFSGDLGIDDGTARSVYTLSVDGMTQLTGGDSGADSIELRPGETAELPNGWGTLTFEDEAAESGDVFSSVKRFASLQVHHDGSAVWVLTFSVLAMLGLLAGLFVPRRRMWVKGSVEDGSVRLEYAGLARGEDPNLSTAVAQLAEKHLDTVDPERPRG